MSFRRYWLARVKESFGKGRVISEAAGFILLLISGLVTRDVPPFPLGRVIWWILFGGFVAALVIEICLISPAEEAARLIKERDQAQKELERIRDYQIARRRRARDTCLEHCVEIYANTRPALMIGALWRAQLTSLPQTKTWFGFASNWKHEGMAIPLQTPPFPRRTGSSSSTTPGWRAGIWPKTQRQLWMHFGSGV